MRTSGEPALELHPQELLRRRWQDGDLVRVKSRRGELVLPVRGSAAVQPAQAFIAMHWGAEYMAGLGVNTLTTSAVCPQSRQPELKHTAVRLAAAALPWQLVAAAWLPSAESLAVRERLRQALGPLAYGICVPFGREPQDRMGLLFRAAAAATDLELVALIEDALLLSQGPVLRYADARAGQSRAMRVHADGTLQSFMLAGDAAAQGWVLDLLQQGLPAAAFGRALLAASRQPPQPVPVRSPQVCACHDVSEEAIVMELARCEGAAARRLLQLQQTLRCGTECGSCLPALKQLVQCHDQPALAN